MLKSYNDLKTINPITKMTLKNSENNILVNTEFGVESLIDQEKSSQEELIRMELKVIGCLLDIVGALNIKDFKLEINNIGSSETKKKYSKELVSFLETNLDTLSDTEKNRLSTNPLRILDSKELLCF